MYVMLCYIMLYIIIIIITISCIATTNLSWCTEETRRTVLNLWFGTAMDSRLTKPKLWTLGINYYRMMWMFYWNRGL